MALHSLALIVGAISPLLSCATQKKKTTKKNPTKLAGFVGFGGSDWFELLKRVGFCVIWSIVVAGVSPRVCVRTDGGDFLHISAPYSGGSALTVCSAHTAEKTSRPRECDLGGFFGFSCLRVNSVLGRSRCK